MKIFASCGVEWIGSRFVQCPRLSVTPPPLSFMKAQAKRGRKVEL